MKYVKIILLLFFITFYVDEKVYSFDTMIDYENKTRDGSAWFSHIDNCFSSGKAVFQLSVGDFNNVSIPHYLKANNTIKQGSRAGWSELATIGRAILYMDMLLSFSPASIFALVAIGVEYLVMLDICTNAFIIAPHEYANLALGYECEPKDSDGNVKFVQGDNPLPPLTAVDVPFFYHCDPKYEPGLKRNLIEADEDYREKLDNTYGYMLEASPYCTNQYGQLVIPNPTKKLTFKDVPSNMPTDIKALSDGHVLVYHTSTWERIF